MWLNSSEVSTATASATCSGSTSRFEQRALRVERAELVLGHAVDGGALRAPAAGEDAAAAHDAVGVDAVDPDAVLAELGGEQPHLVGLVGLRRAVGDVVRAGEHRVLRDDVDDVAAEALVDHRLGRGLRHEEAALGHDVVLEVPVALGGLEQRLGDRQAGVVDDRSTPPNASSVASTAASHRGRVGHVDRDADGDVVVAELGGRRLAPCRGRGRRSTTQAPSAASCARDRLADAARRAGDERDAAGVALRLRQPLQLRLLERPVLDAELLGLGDRVRRSRPPRRRASR